MKLKLFLLVVLAFFYQYAYADFEKNYQNGLVIDTNLSLGQNNSSALDDFYKAIYSTNDFFAKLVKISKGNKNNKASSLANYELAKIYTLQRNFKKAKQYANKVNSNFCHEKFLVLSEIELELANYSSAIKNAQKYLQKKQSNRASFIVAEALRRKKKFKAAQVKFNVLTKKASSYLTPLAMLHKADCYFEIENQTKATQTLKSLIKKYPYSTCAYKAEDFLLKKNSDEDLLEKQLANIVSKSHASSIYKNKTELSVKPLQNLQKQPSQPPVKQQNTKNINKLLASSPSTIALQTKKYYLQAGAFSSKKNANKMENRIKKYGFSTTNYNKIKNGKQLFVVAAGPFNSKLEAKTAKNELNSNKINTFILKK